MADSNKAITAPALPDRAGLAFLLFSACAALLPIGLGGNRPFPLGLAQAALAASYLLFAFTPQARLVEWPRRVCIALCLLAATLFWGWLQTMSFLPSGFAHPLWLEAEKALRHKLDATIAVAPEDARAGLGRLCTYIAAGVIAFCLGREAQRAHQFLQLLWFAGLGVCLYGLIAYGLGTEKILWFDKWAYKGDLTATFVNHSHFAIYGGMILTTGLALFIQSWRTHMRDIKPTQKVAAFQAWFVKKGLPYSLALALVILSIALSNSRAGALFSLGGAFCYIFFYQIYTRNRGRAIIVAIMGLIATIAVTLFAIQSSSHFSGLLLDNSARERAYVYDLTLQAIRDNPWLGYGLNGFTSVFRLYQHDMALEFNHAHSDIMESLLDLGVPGALMLWGGIALLIGSLWHGITTRKRDGMYPVLALSITLMLLAHASVDFSLSIPAIAIGWASLLGIGLAQSWSSRKNG